MNRIIEKFQEIRKSGRKALVGYLTAGDPDLKTSEKNIRCMLDNGVDILELGVPFSDPIADGPVIQAASQRALKDGATLEKVLVLVSRLRKDYDNPIILFGYANPFLVYGYDRICKNSSDAGVDGMLIVDLPNEEANEFQTKMAAHKLIMIPVIAPTTPEERAEEVLKNAKGFVYYIIVRGVTGARKQLASDLEKHISDLRKCTDLPIAVGFGISDGAQAGRAARWADGVVVGSALIQAAQENRLASFVQELRNALIA